MRKDKGSDFKSYLTISGVFQRRDRSIRQRERRVTWSRRLNAAAGVCNLSFTVTEKANCG